MFDSISEAYIRRVVFFSLHILGLLSPSCALNSEGDGDRQGIELVHARNVGPSCIYMYLNSGTFVLKLVRMLIVCTEWDA